MMNEYADEEENISKAFQESNSDEFVCSSIPSQIDINVKERDGSVIAEDNGLVDYLVTTVEHCNVDKDIGSPSPDACENKTTSNSAIYKDATDINKSQRNTTKDVKIFGAADTPKQRLKYSRDQLLKLMDVPASRLWPVYFDVTFQKPQGKIDLDRWMRAKQDGQRGGVAVSAPINVPVSQANGVLSAIQSSSSSAEKQSDLELKRSKDPRDRVKQEEQDGIILSPQRRSFGTGCHAFPQCLHSQPTAVVPEASLERPSRESHREIPARRIGSGRILRREDPDQIVVSERKREPEKEMEQRRDHKDWRNKNESRYEREERQDKRRRFFEEEEKRTNDRKDGRDRRYPDHRRLARDEEEPEWFTGGPSSQNEYIELVGFEETDEHANVAKPRRERRKSKKEKEGSRKGSRCNTPTIQEQDESHDSSEQTRREIDFDREKKEVLSKVRENPVVIEPVIEDQDIMQFNIEDFLGDLLNIASEETNQNSGASRLKQFFKDTDSPIGMQGASNSRRNSMDSKFSDAMVQRSSPKMAVDCNRLFAPISPADNTRGDALAGLLQQATAQTMQHSITSNGVRLQPPSVKDLMMGGKSQSLEEIEAGMHKNQMPFSGVSSINTPTITHESHQSANYNQMKPGNGAYQKNPFNDFLSQVSQSQRKIFAEQNRDCDNVLTKLLKDPAVIKSYNGKNPAMPNNAPTETELITSFMKGKNINPINGCPSASQLGNNIHQRLFASQHSVANLSVPPQSMTSNLPSHSSSHAHLMPPQSLGHPNQDIIMKLMQNQHQLQNQKKQMHQQNYHQQQHSQHQSIDPIKQLMGGLNNLGLPNHPHDPPFREAHLRPDVQNLLQCVLNGQIKDSVLIAQLNAGNISHQQREAITTVLKILNNPSGSLLMPPRSTLTPSPTAQGIVGGALSLGTPASLSPRVASPIPESSNLLAPHVLQQARVSPLMFAGGSIPGSAPRRTPSHQELVVHAQSILQKALLKQELEKAKEKHRKREAERTRSPNPAVAFQNGCGTAMNASILRNSQDGSPSKGSKCQSPLVFTPTSVMRKMTAERERLDKGDKQESLTIHVMDKDREQSSLSHNIPPPPAIQQNPLGSLLKVECNIQQVPSPVPQPSMYGSTSQMAFNGPNSALINMGENHGLHHMSSHRNIAMGRSAQQNIRVMQNAQSQGVMNQLMVRNAASGMHIPHSTVHLQSRFPNNNSFQHNSLTNNNNNYKGEPNPQISMNNGSSSHRNSPVSLRNLFGRDLTQAHSGVGPMMPELPDGKVLSLEEVERLHQSHIVPI